MFKTFARRSAVVASFVIPFAARADVAAGATDAIAGAATDVAAIGGAVFLVMVGIKLVKWVRRAL